MTVRPLSRRAVVSAGALTASLAAVVHPGEAHAAPEVGLYARSRFAPLIGQRFRVGDGGRGWIMELTAVADLPSAPAGSEGSFSLTFRSRERGPAQGSYTLRRTGFTPTPLLVVAVDAEARTYEAVVNNG